jgi:GTPase SAR1 family protein
MQGGRLSTRPPLAPEGLSLEDFIAVHVLVADCVDFLGPTHHLTGPLNDLAIKARDLLLFSHTVSTGTSRVEVVVIGEFSSGKSSFVNSLLGEVLCPVDVAPTTSAVTRFAFDREIRIVDEITGAAVRPEDYADLARHPPEGGAPSGGARRFTYYGPFPELQSVAVTDTPGFDNPDAPDDAKVTHDAAAQADVVIFVFDAQRGEVSGATEAILDELRTRRPETPWIAVVNRADTRTPKDLARIVENLRTVVASPSYKEPRTGVCSPVCSR